MTNNETDESTIADLHAQAGRLTTELQDAATKQKETEASLSIKDQALKDKTNAVDVAEGRVEDLEQHQRSLQAEMKTMQDELEIYKPLSAKLDKGRKDPTFAKTPSLSLYPSIPLSLYPSIPLSPLPYIYNHPCT